MSDLLVWPATTTTPSSTSVRSGIMPLLGILLGGAVVRIALLAVFYNQPLQIWDERDYNDIANNLVRHGQFAFTPKDQASVAATVALAAAEQGPLLSTAWLATGRGEAMLSPQPTSLRPPLYPALLAIVYSQFGTDNYLAARILQLVISLLTVIVVYALGKEVYDQRIGLIAAGLYCFYPSAVAYGNLLLTEVLFTFLLCLASLFTVRFFRRDAIIDLVIAGALFGFAALTRSVLWLFPPVLALLVLATCRVPLSRRVLAIAGMVVAFGLVLAPWTIRNTRLQRTFVTVDVMSGRNFMMGNYEHTPLLRSWDAIANQGEKSWEFVLRPELAGVDDLTQGKVDRLALKHGLEFVKKNPGLTAQRDLVKFVQFWGLERELVAGAIDGFWGKVPTIGIAALAALVMGSYVLAMLTGAFGAVAAPPNDWRIHLFLLFVVAFICGMHSLVFSHSRYHLPLMPLILVYSASALAQGRALLCVRSWRLWMASAICAFLIAGWCWEIFAVDGEKISHALNV